MFWLKIILVFFSFFSFSLFASIGEIYADTHTATSCSYSDVSAAIAAASTGDTVLVPSGSCTWSSTLEITKAITLQGAGIGETNITGDIAYTMPNPSVYSLFRLTGFSITGTLEINNKTAYKTARIRIDHSNVTTNSGVQLNTNGTVYGVIDNNVFNGRVHWDIYGDNQTSWGNIVFEYGTADTLFIEDNEINETDFTLHQSTGLGGMFVWRYNDFHFSASDTSNVYWLDMHGDQKPGSNHATMGAEMYGNRLDSTTAINLQVVDHRGGSAIIFWNKATGTPSGAWYKCRNECEDSGSGEYTCDNCANGHVPCCGPEGQPQHVSDSYYWNNRYGETGTSLVTEVHLANTSDHLCIKPGYHIAQNQDFWIHNPSYNGTTEIGVGCGSSLPSNCTTGDGFWVTNQSCNSISDDNVGMDPTTPITGTFYKCTSTDTWEEYYTPYTYPHPLRNPSAPKNLHIANQ